MDITLLIVAVLSFNITLFLLLAMVVVLVKRIVDRPTEFLPSVSPNKSFTQELKELLPGKPNPETVPMPTDIVDYCGGWADVFAQDDCKAKARQLYMTSRNWDAVRTDLGREIGENA